MQILQMRPSEVVAVDADRLGALCAELGEAGAEDVVCRALEEMATRLSRCAEAYASDRVRELRKQARALAAIADQVGMELLKRVALDVVHCVEIADRTALGATVGRLLRIGDTSLTAIWDTEGITI
ncbi:MULTISPECIES: hypothetical protein [unclassified Sulfitobacter]|uniref:hypothetical protein n=1 Tax=unclassified Sulfitobacter TaxID=196795 RepID=UPI0007C40CF0|nr:MULTISPECIES: hypothetical protein [unclassified Sulfitobacter]MAM25030.1 hypothetical protein [Paracoccaceae bacterium]KZX97773.1 hypothetical protein A3721_07210 [Sulfitobacter sp. HI0023]KZY27421.1 hypothetical protein A3728_12390 [Sulfitobacter sp. HI0040]KZZ64864.1 hypothetical protein A3764_04105 [Sulfitobacter sp. HI0129]MBO27487.1 hypothetical protein [Paracoccaceae bacterium]|tara:strand:- start:109 stop:486 length:378 start_codon:yes stop_codon:yes gene_type:complete